MKEYRHGLHGFRNAPKRLVVVGPPGTGKTRTALEHYLLEALASGRVAEEILCCSYSVAAAKELRERAAKSIGISEGALWQTCSTIHSEALRRIKTVRDDWELYDGLTKKTKPLTGKKEIDLDGVAGGRANESREAAIRVWDYCRVMLQTEAADVRRALDRERGDTVQIAHEIEAYREEKQRPCIDFTDMLVEALRAPPRRLALLLVDEIQDCSPLQWALIEHWASMAERVVVIGDPDQAVHEWMGAAPDLLLKRMGEWEACYLDQSYRVPVAAHVFARGIITRNKGRVDAPYRPAEHFGSVIQLGCADDAARWIDEELGGRTCFVLARAGVGLADYGRALMERGVPHVNQRGFSPWGNRGLMRIAFAVISMKEAGWCDAASLRALVRKLMVRGTGYFTGKKTSVLESIEGDDETPIEWGQIDGLCLERVLEGDTLTCLKRWCGVAAYALWVAWKRGGNAAIVDAPRVVLTTMHSSKGREADVVMVHAGVPYPSRLAMEDGGIEAERRVLYVAATRTRDVLAIVGEGYEDLKLAEVPF